MRRCSPTRTALCAAALAVAMAVAAAPAGAHTLRVTPALYAVVSGAGTDVTAWVTDGSPNETIQFTVSGYGTLSHTTVETDSTGHALNHFTASSSDTGLATVTAVDLDDGTLGPASCQIAVIKVTPGANPLWWFSGAAPAGYATQTTLAAAGPGGTYTWTVTNGTGRVGFLPGLGSTAQGVSVDLQSKGQSVPPSTSDVTIRLQWNTYTVTSFTKHVRAPQSVEVIAPFDDDYNLGSGYESHVWYKCKDQYGAVLPSWIDVNESWTTDHYSDPNYSGEQWERPQETPGAQRNPAKFDDDIWFNDTTVWPPVQNPQTPRGQQRVDYWGQMIRVGSIYAPNGKSVGERWFQRYRDHANTIPKP